MNAAVLLLTAATMGQCPAPTYYYPQQSYYYYPQPYYYYPQTYYYVQPTYKPYIEPAKKPKVGESVTPEPKKMPLPSTESYYKPKVGESVTDRPPIITESRSYYNPVPKKLDMPDHDANFKKVEENLKKLRELVEEYGKEKAKEPPVAPKKLDMPAPDYEGKMKKMQEDMAKMNDTILQLKKELADAKTSPAVTKSEAKKDAEIAAPKKLSMPSPAMKKPSEFPEEEKKIEKK